MDVGGILMKKMAVYCGASAGNNPIYAEKAKELGQWMVENDYHLVYGGGKVGLMGIVADTVLSGGNQAIGVMPTFLVEREISHKELTELYTVKNMHERKKKMIDLADVYLALPGGPGTLEEISEVVSWGRVGEHKNPCIFYNVDGYYDLLADFFNKMVETGFLTEKDREYIFFGDTLEEISQYLSCFKAPDIRIYEK